MLISTLGMTGMAATLPGTIELAVLTAGSLLPARPRESTYETCGAIAVVVPAHDEEAGIATCVQSLLACERPTGGARVVVVADNCSDETAARARDAGAEVLERHDPERRGKGYALELAFAHVLSDASVEAVLVVDADTRVEPNFLVAAARAFSAGADGVQCRYLIGNPDEVPGGRILNLAFRAFNVARPRARERLGLSVGILGNGFGLHRQVLEALPYTARSVVEDLEYHLMLVRAGYRIAFLDETSVTADLPVSAEGQRTQRRRWEGGRFRMVREQAPALLGEVLQGRVRLAEPLGELLLLPLGTHVGVLGFLLVLPFPPTQLYAAGALSVVAAHVGATLLTTGADRRDLIALLGVPGYVARKLRSLPDMLRASKRAEQWVRTSRERE